MSIQPPSSQNPKGFDSISVSTKEVKPVEASNISSEIADKILKANPADAGSVSMYETGVLPFPEVSYENLERMSGEISNSVNSALILKKTGLEAALSIREYIEANGSEIISKLIVELQEGGNKAVDQSESTLNVTKTTETTLQTTAATFFSSLVFISREASNTIDFLRLSKEDPLFGADALHALKGVEVGAILLNLLGAAGSAVVIQSLINQANKEIDLKKTLLESATGDEKMSLEREINVLNNWVQLHHRTLSDQLKETAVSAVLAFPKIGAAICVLLEKSSTVIGSVFSGLSTGVGVVGSMWEWYKTKRDIVDQKLWVKGFSNHGLSAQELYDKQKAIYDKRMKKNLPLLESKLQPVIERLRDVEHLGYEEQQELLKSSLLELKEQGFKVAPEEEELIKGYLPVFPINLEKAASPKELLELLSASEVQHELNKQMVQKSEMLSGSLRNALKTFIIKKEEIERGFLKCELFKIKISTTAVIIMAGLWIAVKAAVLPAMIGGAATGLVVSGYGMLALAAVLLVVGLGYLYYKKPNVFKTMCKGVYLELALRKIPLAIQQYRRQSALLDTLTVAERSQAVTHNMLALQRLEQVKDKNIPFKEMPEGLQKHMNKTFTARSTFTPEEIGQGIEGYLLHLEEKLDHYKVKMEVLNKRVLGLNNSVQEQQKKVDELQNQVNEAGWEDYQHQLRQNKDKVEKSEEGKSKEDDTAIFASFLLSDEGLLQDPDIISILEQMDIDLQALRAAPCDQSSEKIAKAIKSFFAMDDRELLHVIRTFNKKKEFKTASS